MATDHWTKSGFEAFGLRPDETIKEIAKQASRWHEGYRIAFEKSRWADKTPQYIEILDGLKLLFGPGARFVMIYRHPLDSLFSIYKRGWKLSPNADTSFETALAHVRNYLDLQTKFEIENPSLCVRLRYEDLVGSPEQELRRVFSFLEEPWDERVLRFYDFDANYGVEDPVVRGLRRFIPSHGNWVGLTSKQIDSAAHALEAHLSDRGYSADPMAFAKPVNS